MIIIYPVHSFLKTDQFIGKRKREEKHFCLSLNSLIQRSFNILALIKAHHENYICPLT